MTKRERIATRVARSVTAAETPQVHHPDFASSDHPGSWDSYDKGYVYRGGPGGGNPTLPSAVPAGVADQFHETFNRNYVQQAAMSEGADPNDPDFDTHNYSETQVDDASGYAVLTRDQAHAADHDQHEGVAGIIYGGHEVDPISFQGPDGETWHLSGGVGGV